MQETFPFLQMLIADIRNSTLCSWTGSLASCCILLIIPVAHI